MERTQDFDVPADELWEAVTDPERMAWLGDEVALDVQPGGTGRVTDGDETREVVVDEVEAGRRLSFRWWPEGDEDRASRVELLVAPRPIGSRLVVRESLLAPVVPQPAPLEARAGHAALADMRFLAFAPGRQPLPAGAPGSRRSATAERLVAVAAVTAWDRRLLVLGLATLRPLAVAGARR